MSVHDLFITGGGEVAVRQELTLVALGKQPADFSIHNLLFLR